MDLGVMYMGIFRGILSISRNIVMDPNNVVQVFHDLKLLYISKGVRFSPNPYSQYKSTYFR